MRRLRSQRRGSHPQRGDHPAARLPDRRGIGNNQLDRIEDAERLHERGILYAPDYVVNGGGAIAFGMMHLGDTDEEAMRERVREIENRLDHIFSEARQRGESPMHGARRVAEEALRRGREKACI